MKINLKLKDVLEDRGIKQSYLCEKTGLSADSVSRILRGTRKISAEEFLNICEALNLDPRSFKKSAQTG